MANTPNSVDLFDPNFLTTHAELITDKEDFIPTTRAQSQQRANKHWGNWVDDAILALQSQGILPQRFSVQTTDATPTTAGTVATVASGSVLRVDMECVGRVIPNDLVYVRVRARFQRSGATILVDIDEHTTDYSSGGSLIGADANLVVSGNDVIVEVTGEAATTIDWQALPKFLEVYEP